jgi:hypothetical protein
MANFYGSYAGFGSGGAAAGLNSLVFAGTTYGFTAGGTSNGTTIEKLDFSSTSNSVDTTADLAFSLAESAGAHNLTHGFSIGGTSDADYIQSWAFDSGSSNALDVGNMSVGRTTPMAASTTLFIYSMGGRGTSTHAVIDKMDNASYGDMTSIATLNTGRGDGVGGASEYAIYSIGGLDGSSIAYVNDKMDLATEANATQVATTGNGYSQGEWSYGYQYLYEVGGCHQYNFARTNRGISRMDTTTDSNTVGSIGNLALSGPSNPAFYGFGRHSGACVHSTTHGFISGGTSSAGGGSWNSIEKYDFSSTSDATDMADLSAANYNQCQNWNAGT